MSIIKKIFKKRKANRSIITQFATIIGVTTFITLFFISSFNLYASVPIMNQARYQKDINNHSISNLILDSIKKEVGTNSFSQTDMMMKKLISSNLIVFAALYDRETKSFVWSSLSDMRGKKYSNFSPASTLEFTKSFRSIPYSDFKEVQKNFGHYTLVTVFINKDGIIPLADILIRGNLILAVIFIIFGFATALISAKIVTKPLNELVKGTEAFSKGDLSYRAKVFADDEIGKLAFAFNSMAENLDTLYHSLEQQVKDRTAELEDKKEQVEKALNELKETQAMLIHNEKMTSLGQLVAGVAHELNNPINFIYGNLEHLKNYANDLIGLVKIYEKHSALLPANLQSELENAKDEYDFEFISEDLPSLIKSCKDGSERCKQIVLDLRNFSRLDEAIVKEVDIHDGIDTTLNILHNKYKNRIDIHKNYGELPKLTCYAGQLNQVFMNILDNASYAIKDKGNVYLSTLFDGENIVITIEDNGEGIDKDVLSKVFDPFFTTKPVGQGTGLGLSISYKVIKKHNGIIEVESEKGKGTKFTIKLPVEKQENK